jgi:hypothetical protein
VHVAAALDQLRDASTRSRSRPEGRAPQEARRHNGSTTLTYRKSWFDSMPNRMAKRELRTQDEQERHERDRGGDAALRMISSSAIPEAQAEQVIRKLSA